MCKRAPNKKSNKLFLINSIKGHRLERQEIKEEGQEIIRKGPSGKQQSI